MSDESEMRINPQRAAELTANLQSVLSRITTAASSSSSSSSIKSPRAIRLIAVSKLKPANDILALHNREGKPTSQIDFGENYAQELSEKAALLPSSIRWHFIGALQSNKCKNLATIPNLYCVSSVDSTKKADALERGRAELSSTTRHDDDDDDNKGPDVGGLRVQVQVNTSGEEAKSGVDPEHATGLCRHIRASCPHLRLDGLMTIGAIARSKATTPETENEDFVALRQTRDRVASELGIEPGELRLSMGMSSDFESAVRQGSDEVRVGTGIFGSRPDKKDAVIKMDVAEEKA